jgi:hypothetical protein
MVVGQDVTVLCVDYDTRSGTADFTLPPKRVTSHLGCADIDDGRCRSFD